MHIPHVLSLVLAGGQGSRMGVLTANRAKPALRMGGTYRMIDIALSNLANSHLSTVWVIEQYLPHSLNRHLSGGRPWDLDRNRGGLHLHGPFEGAVGEGFAGGNSDTLWRQKELIRSHDPEFVLVLSADHLYTMNLADVVDTHRDQEAELTMVTTVKDGDASRHGVVRTAGNGAVEQFWYKPEDPPTNLVATEIFCFSSSALLEVLDELGGEGGEGGELADWGEDLIPHFVAQRRTVEHRLEGYWRDIGTIPAYWDAHRELLEGTGVRLDDPHWPIRSAQPQLVPARVGPQAAVSSSFLAPGSSVDGSVRRSVIGPTAVIEQGAEVVDSVLLDGVRVHSGARLRGCVVTDGARIPGDARIGSDEEVTLVDVDGTIDGTDERP